MDIIQVSIVSFVSSHPLNYSEVGSPVILPLQILPAVISRVMLSPVMFLHDW